LLIATAAAVGGALAADPVRVDESGGLAAVDHPVGWFSAVQGVLLLVIFGLSLSFIVRQALSWRRADGGAASAAEMAGERRLRQRRLPGRRRDRRFVDQ